MVEEVGILDKSSNNSNNTVEVISTLKDSRIMVLRLNSHSNHNTEEEVEVTSIMKVPSLIITEEVTISLHGMGVKNQHITVEVDGKVEVVLVAEVEEGMVEEVDSLKNHGKRNLEEIVAEDITEVGLEVVGKIKTAINKIFKKVSKNKVLSLSVKNLKRKQLFSSSLPMTISM